MERNINVWLPIVNPQWGPGLLGIELATLWFAAHAQSTELHQPGLNYIM